MIILYFNILVCSFVQFESSSLGCKYIYVVITAKMH